jgi:hypothetical protein
MTDLARKLYAHMSARKRWWLMPVTGLLLIAGGLLTLAEGPAPLVYSVF